MTATDCCDSKADGCDDPELVNPGAYDYPANGVDEDCSSKADDVTSCDGALASNPSTALDYARALELCQVTNVSPAMLSSRRWGVLSAAFTLADGTGMPVTGQTAIRPAFGAIDAQNGTSMMVLSTGSAAAPGDTNPAYLAFQPGQVRGSSSGAPADWLAANGGTFPSAPGCPAPVGVNLATSNTGLFSQCVNGSIGCESGAVAGTTSVCVGTSDLQGTGFDTADTTCGASGQAARTGRHRAALAVG